MIKNIDTRYTYVADYLFINLLNTINGENDVLSDLLEEKGMIDAWLTFMIKRGLLHTKQVEYINEVPIDIEKIRSFRNECRDYFVDTATNANFLEDLAIFTNKVPLAFDKELRPIPSKGGAEGLISLIAYDMLHAQHNGIFPKITKCKSHTCYALFVNTSGRRKWCSMQVCGNRTKARTHYAKKVNKKN